MILPLELSRHLSPSFFANACPHPGSVEPREGREIRVRTGLPYGHEQLFKSFPPSVGDFMTILEIPSLGLEALRSPHT